MKILFLTNNDISYKLYKWLRYKKNQNVILCKDKISLKTVLEIQPNMIISYNYKYIIKKDVIDYTQNRIINLHTSLLPWNRGSSPNLWSFLENTPKGVTIHFIDEGLDTGNILLQKEIYFDESKETLQSSYDKLHEEIQNLFKENWDDIKNNNIVSKPQSGIGSKHFIKDFKNIEEKIKKWDIDILELKKYVKK
ncbi:formyltransferase family protein [Clostridium tagluense]|uniref:formyltransferase family protein n=1 Tax=Clostridium tagluense TaxID=360422 RepID=UPI001C0D92FB|nr:formyltransferase family protein [Clostridium tagluense]MBU3126665.1 formyl transferase [Clostridium tagluense]